MSDLVFYARRLKQESVTRTFSAIAAVLIIGLQFATIAAPPAPTNAASPNDIIYGGIVSKADLLNRYDSSAELQTLYNYFGISRADVTAAHETTINSKDHSLRSIGRNQHDAADIKITLGSHTYWSRGLYVWDTGANVQNGSSYKVLEGKRSKDGGYFAVMFHCGNIVYKTLPPKPTPTPPPKPTPTPTPIPTPIPTPSPTPKPTAPPKVALVCTKLTGNITGGEAPLTVDFTGAGTATGQTLTEYQFNFGDGKTTTQSKSTVSHTYTTGGKFTATLAVKGSTGAVSAGVPACSYTITVTTPPAAYTRGKSALNLTQSLDATTKPAHAGDVIRYTLNTKNIGGTADTYTVVEHVEDILEYADITDTGGGVLKDGVLAWTPVNVAPGASFVKAFSIKVKDPLPATPVGLSDKFSYDLRMDNIYGNNVRVTLEAPLAKQVEVASTNLPDTGSSTATLITLAVSAFTLFFYFRNRQLMTEIKLLRGQYQGGGGYL